MLKREIIKRKSYLGILLYQHFISFYIIHQNSILNIKIYGKILLWFHNLPHRSFCAVYWK